MKFTREETISLIAFYELKNGDYKRTIDRFGLEHGYKPTKHEVREVLEKEMVVPTSATHSHDYGAAKRETIASFKVNKGNFKKMRAELGVTESQLVHRCKNYSLQTTNGPNYSLEKRKNRITSSGDVFKIRALRSNGGKDGNGQR